MDVFPLLPHSTQLLSFPCMAVYGLILTLLYLFLFRFPSTKKEDVIKLADVIKNGHRLLDWTADLLRASPTSTITLLSSVITANPANIEHFLTTRFDNYPKGEALSATLRDLLGGGIFNADGDLWRLQRKTASLQFNTKSIRAFVMDTVRLELAARLLPLLSSAAASPEPLDLQDALERFAFDNVCRVAFGVDPGRLAGDAMDGGRFARAFDEATAICTKRFQQPRFLWRLRRALRVGDERRLREEIDVVNEFATRVVRERKAQTEGKGASAGDLLSRFVGEGDFSDEFLRDIVISFVLAGRDTTSTALTWFFYNVSSRPEVRQRIQDEIESVRSRRGGSGPEEEMYTLEELREMEYLHAALSETLRLYPPVPLQPRTCAADDVMPDGTWVRKGWSVMYNSYAMGRMESIWGKDCEEFRPERWLERGVFQPKSPYKFPIFHAGPRTCLGKEMAYIQMKAIAASLLQRFDIEVAEEGERVHDFTIVLRMKGGLPVRVTVRQPRRSVQEPMD